MMRRIPMNADGVRVGMKIGQLARRTQVNEKTIRYYESIGLLPRAKRDPRNNYRMFGDRAVAALDFIRNARQIGFTLLQTRRVIEEWFKGRPILPAMRRAIQHKAVETRERIQELHDLQKRLRGRSNVAIDSARRLETLKRGA